MQHDMSQWNVYGAQWTETYIAFFLNGAEILRYNKPAGADFKTWPFDQEFYLIINMAIDPWWAPQSPPLTTSCSIEVDWIRVRQ